MELSVVQEMPLTESPVRCSADEFRSLVEAYKKRIFHLAFDLTGSIPDAEDLSQEVFIKAFRAFDRFRSEAGHYTWLYRITVNTFIDECRKLSSRYEKYRQEFDEEIPDRLPQNGSGPERQLESTQIDGHIERALDRLSKNERTVFILKHRQQLRIDEIAALMEIAPGTVKSFLFRSMRKMRDALKGHFGFSEASREADDG